MSKTDVYWLQSINCKEGGRMIGGTGPLVLVSSAQWFSVAGEERRGEERWEGNISLLSFGGRFSNSPGEVSYYRG